jgi:hypothetical protein
MVSRNREHGRAERAEQGRRPLELLWAASVSEIARRDDELRLRSLHESCERPLDVRLLVCTRVEIGNMKETRVHKRTRL